MAVVRVCNDCDQAVGDDNRCGCPPGGQAVGKVALFEAEKVSSTKAAFFPTEHHPLGLIIEVSKDGAFAWEGLVPRATVERLFEEGSDVLDFFLFGSVDTWEGEKLGYRLPANAVFWPVHEGVLKQGLSRAALKPVDLFCFRGENPLDRPGYVAVYESPIDHRVWGLDGKFIPVPTRHLIFSGRFDLLAAEKHLLAHPAVLSVKLGENKLCANDPQGDFMLEFVVDVAQLDLSEPAWFEVDDAVTGFTKGRDPLGLKACLRSIQK